MTFPVYTFWSKINTKFSYKFCDKLTRYYFSFLELKFTERIDRKCLLKVPKTISIFQM